MNLRELKTLLHHHREKGLRLLLPAGGPVPVSFHITEVGHVRKQFIDCGGSLHLTETCQLQAWVGEDEDHRLAGGKLLGILEKSAALLPDDGLPVEIEYEDGVISQFPVASAEVSGDAIVLRLTLKHTDCLAREICLPAAPAGGGCGCGPSGCCD